jgi:hypothetical protein
MNRHEANQILDKVREGDFCPEDFTTLLLHITGDLGAHAPMRGKGVDIEASAQDWRGRVRQRFILVGRSKE